MESQPRSIPEPCGNSSRGTTTVKMHILVPELEVWNSKLQNSSTACSKIVDELRTDLL